MANRTSGRRTLLVYLLLVGVPALALLFVLRAGAGLAPSTVPLDAREGTGAAPLNLLRLLVQIAIIIAAARAFGRLFRWLGQPQVVGEMAAGLALGPTVLGAIAPETFARIFPAASLQPISALSQLGLILFMFLVGLELDPRLLRGQGRAALVTSHAGIVVPFFLGALLAIPLFPRLAPAGVRFGPFALFLGAAMSVTAFPVLARILSELRLTNTRLGAISLACAALADVTAWIILAGIVILARAGGAGQPLLGTIVGSLTFAAVMLIVVRRIMPALLALRRRGDIVSQDAMALILLFALGCAWLTEWLGIHALFGAFMAGAVLPHDEELVRDLTRKLEDFTVVFLLPLFFAFTGLRTRLTLVEGTELWLFGLAIIAVAVAGKFGGSMLAARLTGSGWRDAAGLGALMNTRGLMELVILNIGLDIGVISVPLFGLLVLMAVVTTAMTAPIVRAVTERVEN